MGVIRTSDRDIVGGMSYRRGLYSGEWETAGLASSGLLTVLDFIANGTVGSYSGVIWTGHILAGTTNTGSDLPIMAHFTGRIFHNTPTYSLWISPATSAQANLEIWRETGTDNYRFVLDVVNAYRSMTVIWRRMDTASTSDIHIEQPAPAIADMTGWTKVVG